MTDLLMVVADEAKVIFYAGDRWKSHPVAISELDSETREIDQAYAALIAQKIEEAHSRGQAREIALVMPTPLLELVHQHLDASARNAIFSEVRHRRLGRETSEILREVMDSRSRELSG